MRYDIKHTLLPIMIGLVCASSCSSDPGPDILNSENGEEIMVETAVGSTRATITTTSSLTREPFMLFGDVDRKGEFHSGVRVLFDKAEVTYNDSISIWNYGVKQYWQMGQEHSFVALQPHINSIPGMTELKYEESKVSFNYTIPDTDTTYRDLRDIIVATHRRKYNFENAEPIKFKFQHLLTQIDFTPALNEDRNLMYDVLPNDDEDPHFDENRQKFEFIQFREMIFYGFMNSAKFTVTPERLSSDTNDNSEIDIETDETSKPDIKLNFDEDEAEHIINSNTNISILGENNTIFMIPQTLGPDAMIELAYTVNTDTPEDPIIRRIYLSLANMELESGKRYRICFTIEKVYEGQIADGSLKWEVMDIEDSGAGKNWIIGDTGILKQEFETGK